MCGQAFACNLESWKMTSYNESGVSKSCLCGTVRAVLAIWAVGVHLDTLSRPGVGSSGRVKKPFVNAIAHGKALLFSLVC